jgi:hypothetical protein
MKFIIDNVKRKYRSIDNTKNMEKKEETLTKKRLGFLDEKSTQTHESLIETFQQS